MKQKDEMMYIDNWILTNIYPPKSIDELTLRLLFYMYRIVDLKTGIVDVCYHSFNEVFECEVEDYVDALDWFEQMGLICMDSNSEGESIALLIANANYANIFQEDSEQDLSYTLNNIEKPYNSHVAVREDIFDIAFNELSLQAIRMLLLLNKHCVNKETRVIDQDYICMDNKSEIIMSEEFIRDMGDDTITIRHSYFCLALRGFIVPKNLCIELTTNETGDKHIANLVIPEETNQIELSLIRLESNFHYEEIDFDVLHSIYFNKTTPVNQAERRQS